MAQLGIVRPPLRVPSCAAPELRVWDGRGAVPPDRRRPAESAPGTVTGRARSRPLRVLYPTAAALGPLGVLDFQRRACSATPPAPLAAPPHRPRV